MTWWAAYGRDKASKHLEETADEAIEGQVFTAEFTPGTRPLTVVLLPALFVGDWMWERIHHGLVADGWPVVQFTESISLIGRETARSINRITARLLEATRLHTDQPLVVAGDSLGGLIAFEFARSFGGEIAGLIASGAPGLNVKVNSFAFGIAKGATTPTEFADRFLEKLVHDPAALDIDPDRYQEVVADLTKPESLLAIASAMRAINRYNSRRVVMEVPAPKLFLWGKQDEITPLKEWEEAVPRMIDARLVSFDRCGHGPMFEKPEQFLAETTKFLRELEARMAVAAGRRELSS